MVRRCAARHNLRTEQCPGCRCKRIESSFQGSCGKFVVGILSWGRDYCCWSGWRCQTVKSRRKAKFQTRTAQREIHWARKLKLQNNDMNIIFITLLIFFISDACAAAVRRICTGICLVRWIRRHGKKIKSDVLNVIYYFALSIFYRANEKYRQKVQKKSVWRLMQCRAS